MKREVDSAGNIIIHGLPKQEFTAPAYPPGWYAVEVSKRSRGRDLFGLAIGLSVVLSGTLAFFILVGADENADESAIAPFLADASVNEFQFDIERDRSAGEAQIPLTITSEPAGAHVFIDFEPIGLTPIENRLMPGGVYIVSVGFDTDALTDSVIFLSGGPSRTLEFLLGTSGPSNNTDEPLALATPSELPEPGRQERAHMPAAVTREEGRMAGAPAAHPREQPSRIRERPSATDDVAVGTIRVATNPVGAAVLLNGELRGHTPLEIAGLRPNNYALTVLKEGYAGIETTVGLGPSRTIRREYNLRALAGTLRIRVKPWGTIHVNGELVARETDLRHSLSVPAGTHYVEAEHPVLGRKAVDVQVNAAQAHDVIIDLMHPSEPLIE